MEGIVIEEFIRDSVAAQVNKSHYKRNDFYLQIEVYTIEYKRADVFLAFPYRKGKVYVVVIEAKSRKTLNDMKFTDDESKRLNVSHWIISFCFIGIVSFLYLNKHKYVLDGPTSWLVAIFFTGGTVLMASILKRIGFWFTKSLPVINQLKRYPANEKWLAIGPDSISSRKELIAIRKELEKHGIGLITVNQRGKVNYELLPNVCYERMKKDYLTHYLYEEDIRSKLKSSPGRYFNTKAQRTIIARKIIWAVAVFILFMIILMSLSNQGFRPY